MIQCSQCNKVFKYESERKRHELSHVSRFSCDKCGKKFTYMSALKRHKKQHERTGSVKCEQCYHSFKDEVLLRRHVKYAHEGTHSCSNCGAQFSSHQALSIHSLTHKPKSERRYSCNFAGCNKKFNFSHHLKYHEMTHTKNIQHFCNICGKGFIQLHNLKVHVKTHEPHKLLPCEITDCKKKFKSEYARRRHYCQHKSIVIEGTKAQNLGTPIQKDALIVGVPESTKGHDKSDLKTMYTENKIDLPEVDSRQILPKAHIPDHKDVSSVKSSEQEMNFDTRVEESDEYVTTCRSILGKCIVTGDLNGNANCLCDQMVNGDNNCNKLSKISSASNNTSLFSDTNNGNVTKISCEQCLSTSVRCDDENYTNAMNKEIKKDISGNDCRPKFEYGINGSVKIISTIDEDLENIVNNCKRNSIQTTNQVNVHINENHNVPYNSCKAVLGKCIVSGNGMMSDDCLCAKMLIDDRGITSEEIEEITPQPYNTSMYL